MLHPEINPTPEDQTMQTTAEKIADRFDNDGLRFTSPSGETLFAAIYSLPHRHIRPVDFGPVRVQFTDGSAIVTTSDGWDVGFSSPDAEGRDCSECVCWPDANDGEHDKGCPAITGDPVELTVTHAAGTLEEGTTEILHAQWQAEGWVAYADESQYDAVDLAGPSESLAELIDELTNAYADMHLTVSITTEGSR